MGCIDHPDAFDSRYGRFVPLRPAYVEMCDGNCCAALLLAVFEFWTDQRERQGKDPWVHRAREELRSDLFNGFGLDAIDCGLGMIVDKRLGERRRNPNYGWDRTWQYQLDLEVIQARIRVASQSWQPDDGESDFLLSMLGDPTSNTEEPLEEPTEDLAVRVSKEREVTNANGIAAAHEAGTRS